MDDQMIGLLILKLVLHPDDFTMSELDDLTIALRQRENR